MNSLKRQAGINLIEVMVVGFLMVLVGFFMIRIMTSSNEASSRSEGVAQAQENARLTMEWLFEATARAGYPATSTLAGGESRVVPFASLCSGPIAPPEPNGNCTFESSDPNIGNDRIAINRMYAVSGDSSDARDWVDCTGVDLTGAGLVSQESILTDVYWVERNNGADGDDYDDVLRCVTYNYETGVILNPPQTIASGVEGLQVLYGIYGFENLPDNPGRIPVTSYISADLVTNWNRVYAARVAILTRAFSDSSLPQAKRSYILLDANPYTFDDRVPRQIISSTIYLKNQ